jgi:hypothetical protein
MTTSKHAAKIPSVTSQDSEREKHIYRSARVTKLIVFSHSFGEKMFHRERSTSGLYSIFLIRVKGGAWPWENGRHG